MKIKVNVKSLATRSSAVEATDFNLPYTSQELSTVYKFLDAVTEHCVTQFKNKQGECKILKMLSSDQIEEKSKSGKIAFGVNYGKKNQDLAEAQENTRQCYLDGTFALFIDGKEISGLKESLPLETPIEIHEDSNVTFVRLTMLAGRMY